ncbi:hypothetical protein J2754_002714 [Halarchaeum solikamskense]|uniref:hypothetical protein n=1 Tax=Halarchaeum nitratireducens TaxID=489913 RepID=UPI001B3B1B98|nr:hypothetical protein [Halarchaeum solikamskense]MBP2252368.1 hypothetical protein [Halarchaeum solikamskense]
MLTANIKADRLAEGEIPADAVVDHYPWHETDLVDALTDRDPTPTQWTPTCLGSSAAEAALTGQLAERDVRGPVVLVGGAESAVRHRHFTPTDTELGAYALVSVTAPRGSFFKCGN